MSSVKRPTIKEAKQWYKKNGWTPHSYVWCDMGRKECCFLAAVLFARKGILHTDFLEEARRLFGKEYVCGCVEGFDGSLMTTVELKQNTPEFRAGYRKGRNARKVLLTYHRPLAI